MIYFWLPDYLSLIGRIFVKYHLAWIFIHNLPQSSRINENPLISIAISISMVIKYMKENSPRMYPFYSYSLKNVVIVVCTRKNRVPPKQPRQRLNYSFNHKSTPFLILCLHQSTEKNRNINSIKLQCNLFRIIFKRKTFIKSHNLTNLFMVFLGFCAVRAICNFIRCGIV